MHAGCMGQRTRQALLHTTVGPTAIIRSHPLPQRLQPLQVPATPACSKETS